MKLDSIFLNKYPPCLQIRYKKSDGNIEYDDNYLKSADLESLQERNKILKSLSFTSIQEAVEMIFEKQKSKKLVLDSTKKLHQMQVTSVHMSKLKTIVSMGQDDMLTFQFSQGKTKTVENVLKPFCGAFYNEVFVAGLLSGRVRAFDAEGDDIFNQQTRNNSPCLAVDLCDTKIAFGLADGHSYLADLRGGAAVQKLSTHKGEVSSIARFNNSVYFTGSFDGTVMLNDARVPESGLVRSCSAASGISTSGLNKTYKEPTIRLPGPILSLKANEYYGELVVHGLNNVRLYDYRMLGNPVQEVTEKEGITCLAAGWDGKVCYGLDGGRIKFFNTSNKFEQLFQLPAQQISFLNPGKCQNLLIAEGNRLHCVDLGNGGDTQVTELPSFITVLSAAYTGDTCVVGTRDGSVGAYRFE